MRFSALHHSLRFFDASIPWRRLLIFGLMSTSALPAFGQPSMTLTGRTHPWTIDVGDPLRVDVQGLNPGEKVTLRLVDELGAVVHEASFEARDSGTLKGADAWTRSGVKGCDAGGADDGADYSFSTYQEAEAVLAGRTFRLELRNNKGMRLDDLSLRWDLPGQMRLYWSDASGCPRLHFDLHENVYLSAYRVPASLESLTFFVTKLGYEVAYGRILEAREAFKLQPQVVILGSPGEVWTSSVWDSADSVLGDFNGIARLQSAGQIVQSGDPFLLQEGDLFLNGLGDGSTKVGGDGIRIRETCPPDGCLEGRGCFSDEPSRSEPESDSRDEDEIAGDPDPADPFGIP